MSPSGWPSPNPIDWIKDTVGAVAGKGFELVIKGLTGWITDAVMWVVGGVFNFFIDATDPNVQADWFAGQSGPYAATAAIGATLLVGFVLAAIIQGVFAGDVGGMLRRMIVDVPVAVFCMVALITITQALIQATDAMSGSILDSFQADAKSFISTVTGLSVLVPGVSTTLVVCVLGVVTLLSGLIVMAELVVRAALIYIVVALAPLIFAAQVWPALRGAGRKLLDLLVALILSKLVIAIALSVAAAAAVGTGSGGEVTALPPPEVVAEDPGGSITQAVGILLAAAAAFGVSAFSPLILVKLLPITEAAMVSQGIRGGPMRAAQQGVTMGYYTRYLRSDSRASQLASGDIKAGGSTPGPPDASSLISTGPDPTGGGGAGAAAAGGTGAAAAGPAAVAVAAVGAAKDAATTGAQAMTQTAEASADPSSRQGTGGQTSSANIPSASSASSGDSQSLAAGGVPDVPGPA
jgi:hypothetical protein